MSAADSRHSTDEVAKTRPEARKTILRTCSLLFATLLPAMCFAVDGAGGPVAQSLINKPAPEIARKDLNGARIDLKSQRGKVVLLNFWATWCAPCQIEMPVFATWQRQYGPAGFQIIGISMDDSPGPARKLVSKLKLDYPVAMGDASLGERYGGVLGLPLTYLIDRNGLVRARFQGETDPKTIERQLKLILANR